MSRPVKLGFVGLGAMGHPMVCRLHQAGFELLVHDRSLQAVARLHETLPSVPAADTFQAFGACEVVITMLPNSEVVEAVTLSPDGLRDVLQPGAVLIDMSSSQPARTRALAHTLAAAGLHMLDAPVSGGVRRAIDGSLSIMVGGAAPVLERCRDVLSAMGRFITHVGDAGAGHAAKALNNYVSAAGLLAACEALMAARAFGLDPAILNDVLNHSTGRNNATENKVRQFILSGSYAAGFSLRLMEKDLATAVELCESMGVKAPNCRQVADIWHAAAEELPADADHTEIYRFLDSTSPVATPGRRST